MRKMLIVIIGGSCLIFTLLIWWRIGVLGYLSGRQALPDFDVYYRLVQDTRAGLNPYQVSYMTTAGPPMVLLPWVPFSWWSLSVARVIFVVISLLSGALACWLLARRLRPKQAGRLAVVFQFILWLSFPARFALQMGQWGLVMLLLATVLLTGSRRVQMLALTGLILIKTLFLVAVVGVGRNLQARKWLLLGLALVLAVSLWLTPLKIYRYYLVDRGANYFSQTLHLTQTDYYNQSLKSSLARLSLGAAYPLIGLVMLCALGWLAWRRQDLGLGLLVALCVSPLIWQHYLVMLWPFCWLLLKSLWWQHRGLLPWLCLAVVLIFSQFANLHGQELTFMAGLLASHQFLGLLILTLLWWRVRPLY